MIQILNSRRHLRESQLPPQRLTRNIPVGSGFLIKGYDAALRREGSHLWKCSLQRVRCFAPSNPERQRCQENPHKAWPCLKENGHFPP